LTKDAGHGDRPGSLSLLLQAHFTLMSLADSEREFAAKKKVGMTYQQQCCQRLMVSVVV